MLRPRRNFRMARRGKEKQGNGKNDYALPRARLLLLLLRSMSLYRKRCAAAQHSGRGEGGNGMNIRNLWPERIPAGKALTLHY